VKRCRLPWRRSTNPAKAGHNCRRNKRVRDGRYWSPTPLGSSLGSSERAC
jgi:hypothetical protein